MSAKQSLPVNVGRQGDGGDTNRNGVLDQEELDRLSPVVVEKLKSSGLLLRAGMTVEEMRTWIMQHPSDFAPRRPPQNPAAARQPKDNSTTKIPVATQQLKIFHLLNANPADTAQLVEQLYGGNASVLHVATDERTNSLVICGEVSALAEIEALLLELDTPQKSAVEIPPTDKTDSASTLTASTERLRANYEEHDKQSQAIAANVREAETKLGKDHADAVRLRAELRDSVQQALHAHQRLHRSELAEFQKRIQRLQQSIEARDRIADKIVKRRVEELLDPDSAWRLPETTDTTPNAAPPETAIANSDRIIRPGDVLEISIQHGIRSTDKTTLAARVSKEGEVTIPDVGATKVAGVGVIEAEQRFLKLLTSKDLFRGTPVILVRFADFDEFYTFERSSGVDTHAGSLAFCGTWTVNTFNIKGNEHSFRDKADKQFVTLTEEFITIPFPNRDEYTTVALKYTVRNTGNPTLVDLIFEPNGSGLPTLGIIEFDGDTLKFCYREPAGEGEEALQEKDRPKACLPGGKVYYVECLRSAER